MKKLNLYILKSYLGPLLLTFFIAVFILLMQFLWKYVDDLVGKGLEWHVIVRLLFYASFTFIPLALPLAILMSSLMLFGNLGERYELVAMKSAGISLVNIMKPLVFFSILISISGFGFSNYLLPLANLKMQSLLYDVREQKPALSIPEGIFYNGIDKYVIRVAHKERDNQTIRDVLIYDHSRQMGNTSVTRAEWGTMVMTEDKKYLIFTLYNGFVYDEDSRRGLFNLMRPITRVKFKENKKRFDLSSFSMQKTNEEFFKDNYQMLNVHQLGYFIDSLNSEFDRAKADFSDKIVQNMYYGTNFYDTTKKVVLNDTSSLPKDVMDLFQDNEKVMVFDYALQTARSQKDIVEFKNADFDYQRKAIHRYEIEWHRKFTLSIACLLLFFIGAPLGAIIRKGGLGVPMIITVLIFVLFWVISISGEKFAREGVIPAYIGMWIASGVLFPMGVYLTYKSAIDSPLLDADSWKWFFVFLKNKIIKLFKKR